MLSTMKELCLMEERLEMSGLLLASRVDICPRMEACSASISSRRVRTISWSGWRWRKGDEQGYKNEKREERCKKEKEKKRKE